jgi:hypothetical protein
MSRVLSQNGRLEGGGSGTGPLERLGAMDVTVAGIPNNAGRIIP